MPIFIRTNGGPITAEALGFQLEAELEEVAASQPSLLESDGDSPLAFVAQQVTLPEAGNLDLLFVSETGLPVAVEVKLARNAESRREIVAQIIDYVSDLTSLTNDELDRRVGGALESALRSFDAASEADEFERRWQEVGVNLRAGSARVILVLDSARPDLERIVRFLSDRSNLDVRLVTISKYENAGIGTIYVPQVVVAAGGEPSPRPTTSTHGLRPGLDEVVSTYDRLAPPELQTKGRASNYRQIKLPSWPSSVHYEFYHARGLIGAELHLESISAKRLAPKLQEFAGRTVGPMQRPLEWDGKWSRGCGKLSVRYTPDEAPAVVAQSMLDLIALTRAVINKAVSGVTDGEFPTSSN